jgi:hypothetical protein
MKDTIKYVGLDVSKEKIAVAIIEEFWKNAVDRNKKIRIRSNAF